MKASLWALGSYDFYFAEVVLPTYLNHENNCQSNQY